MGLKLRSKMKTPHNGWFYVDQLTGHKVRNDVFENLLGEIATYRKAHGFQLTEGWQEEVEHTVCLLLDVDNTEDWVFDPDHPPLTRMVKEGHRLWGELHGYALAYPEQPSEEDKVAAEGWFRGWESRIPNLNCKCAKNWRSLQLGLPDLSNRESFYRWTVAAHDRVREKLGQPILEGEFRHRFDQVMTS